MKLCVCLRKRVLAAGLVVGMLAATLLAMGGAGASTGVLRNGEVVADGSWCWFQDPRAVHYVGIHDRTYVGYVTSTGDIDVISQDASTATLTHTTLHPRLQADDHAAPGLVVLGDGRIAVFYTPHTGTTMYYRISVNREDISTFGPELTVPTNTGTAVGYTYANPIYLSAEHRLYLFFRGGNSLPAMAWTTDYAHWSTAATVAVPDHTPPFTRPYAKYATNGVDTIAIAFTGGHPDELSPNPVYEMTLKGGVLRTPDGAPVTVLDPTIAGGTGGAPHTGAAHTGWLAADPASGGLVYQDPGNAPAWIEATAFDANLNPIIVYSTYPTHADALYRYTRWTGTAWADSGITDAGGPIETRDPSYSGAADIDRNSPGTVYLSRETTPTSGVWEIEQWTVADDGTASRQAVLPQDLTQKNVRPVVPWGPPGEINVLWMSGAYTSWAAGFHTQLRELTSGRAPTTARIGVSAMGIKAGTTVNISGHISQGINGAPVAGALVELVGHTAGQPDQVQQRAYANGSGVAVFTRRPSETMRYTIRVAPTAVWGGAVSASALVRVLPASAARISTSATAIRRGQSVVVGMRAVSARTGAPLPRATIELWQHVYQGAWLRVGRYTASNYGLVTVRRSPSVSVVYQARVVASSTYSAASSATATVHVY